MKKLILSTAIAATFAASTVVPVFANNGNNGAAADKVRVIVQFNSQDSQGFQNARASLARFGADYKRDLEALNAVAIEVPAAALNGISNNPHVVSVETDQKRRLLSLWNDDIGDPNAQQLTPYAIYQSGADQVALQAAGEKTVCVIDSGIARETGETGGGNPDFEWSKITGTSNSGTGDWFRDGGPHGTHVAGTVAAADNGYGVVGMAPGNRMHIIKVFNDAGWGYSSDLAFAAERCADAGAEIITMSLGGGGANSTEENAFINFTNNGGLVLAAAGNDGNNVRSYPAGYKSVMMIGANDADNNIATFSQYPGCTVSSGRGRNATTETDDGYCVEVTAGGVDTLSTYPAGGASLASGSLDDGGLAVSAMENTGSASGNTFFMGIGDAIDNGAAGNVCIIDRGSVSFYDKVANCEASGGIAAILINNEPGMLYGTLGTTNDTSIPAVGAAFEDRDRLLASASASVSIGASDYGYMSGTSMATPGAAGIAALIWSHAPACTGAEVRDSIKATALDSGAGGKDAFFGYGIVQAPAALNDLLSKSCAGGDGGGGTDPVDNAPTAAFTSSCTDLSCSFTDGSSDDNGIASYSYDFGDGNSSSNANPSHSYAADGTYTVTLTVTDSAGQSDTFIDSVTVSSGSTGGDSVTFTFTSADKVKGAHHPTVGWNGTASSYDVFVNGSQVAAGISASSFTYPTNNKGGGVSYTFEVCDAADGSVCDIATVNY